MVAVGYSLAGLLCGALAGYHKGISVMPGIVMAGGFCAVLADWAANAALSWLETALHRQQDFDRMLTGFRQDTALELFAAAALLAAAVTVIRA